MPQKEVMNRTKLAKRPSKLNAMISELPSGKCTGVISMQAEWRHRCKLNGCRNIWDACERCKFTGGWSCAPNIYRILRHSPPLWNAISTNAVAVHWEDGNFMYSQIPIYIKFTHFSLFITEAKDLFGCRFEYWL